MYDEYAYMYTCMCLHTTLLAVLHVDRCVVFSSLGTNPRTLFNVDSWSILGIAIAFVIITLVRYTSLSHTHTHRFKKDHDCCDLTL